MACPTRRSARIQARLASKLPAEVKRKPSGSPPLNERKKRRREEDVTRGVMTGADDDAATTAQPAVDVEDVIPNPTIAKHVRTIEQMRKTGGAPVDTMGCHMLADKNADPKTRRFQTLVALMLSSQTKDGVTAAAMERLKARGCTVDQIISIATTDLAALLNPVGFHNRKAEYLKKTTVILKEKYDSDVPATMVALCSLPGVGSKMANLALQVCHNLTEGIGVDTHVHRIANRLEWVDTKTPDQTEMRLREILPRSRWSTINKLLVGFGQTTCLPLRPKCSECLLRSCCPWYNKQAAGSDPNS